MLAAAVSSMVFAAVGWWQLRAEVFQTDIGEVRRVTLADGSSLMLNTATRAEVRLTSASREVRMVRGEGTFTRNEFQDFSKVALLQFLPATSHPSESVGQNYG